MKKIDRRLSIAPMMDCTDRHYRYLARLITRRVLLYTEMIPTGAIVHGDRDRYIGIDPCENPVALQVGGSDPEDMATCARAAAEFGYDEININVGCPSDRVQSGRFGACLMAEPDIVATCVRVMCDAAGIPVTVKTRIGIDDRDDYEHLVDFVRTVADAGCETFIIHARKAWLKGLSPKQNRDVPPLRYDVVRRLKGDFPDLEIILNGGIKTLDAADEILAPMDGVTLDGAMIGRAAYDHLYMLAQADARFYGDTHPVPGRHEVLDAFLPYVEMQVAEGARLSPIARHLNGLFQGVPGARAWRRHLSQKIPQVMKEDVRGDAVQVIREARRLVAND